jgi:2-polyprenyl-6-methoxyphenol hydroxylase-like FAD-dependent oxidoreductase
MRVLISGAGVAGPCLAYWLSHHGLQPTIVERAPRLRTGGYIIDFWGAGFDIAERMGLAPEVLDKGYKMRELRLVDRQGRRVGGFPLKVFDRITHGRYTSLPRSELATALYGALQGRVETIFDDTITAIEDRGGGVHVQFEAAAPRVFDLVVGADGLHSQVRRLVFGDDARFERFLGMKVAAFAVEGYGRRDELTYVMHREVGREIGRFTMRGGQTMFLFVFADDNADVPRDAAAQKALLREKFAGAGWECGDVLSALERSDGLYIDRISQIHMERWTRGRIALVGDAGFCASLLAGQGTALAMIAAYVLAGELKRAGGNHDAAFARYNERLGGFMAAKQKAAVALSSFFAPRSRFGIFVGNQVTKLMSIPLVSNFAVGRELRDAIELPDY